MTKPLNIFYLALVFNLVFSYANGQAPDPRIAKEYYKKGNYEAAIKMFKVLLKTSPGDKNLNRQIGLCYLNSEIDPKKSFDYLKTAYDSSKFSGNLPFYLGKSLTHHYKYEDAKIYFQEYLRKPFRFKHKKEARLHLKHCDFATNNPAINQNISVKNLGKVINTPYPEFYPFLYNDSTLMFSGRIEKRGVFAEFDGLYQSDIFSVNPNDSTEIPKEISKLNTSLDEQICGIYKKDVYVYYDHITDYGNINKYSPHEKYEWRQDRSFKVLSQPKEIETSVFISKDGSKMFYTSNCKDGLGGYDIFMREKQGASSWGEPINLNINTEFDEGFPMLSDDEKTLYFTSNGYPGFGGFDLYKTTWNEGGYWNTPENLGRPINTPSDEKFIWFVNENEAYMSGYRESGYGYSDLYKVIFK